MDINELIKHIEYEPMVSVFSDIGSIKDKLNNIDLDTIKKNANQENCYGNVYSNEEEIIIIYGISYKYPNHIKDSKDTLYFISFNSKTNKHIYKSYQREYFEEYLTFNHFNFINKIEINL